MVETFKMWFFMIFDGKAINYYKYWCTSVEKDLTQPAITCSKLTIETLEGHVHKYQTQLCISRKPQKSFLWITSVYLNFTYSKFSHRRKLWSHKYLLHHHLQIFTEGRVMLKKCVYFLAICANFPCKTEKFELENIGAGILGTGFCFQGSQ